MTATFQTLALFKGSYERSAGPSGHVRKSSIALLPPSPFAAPVRRRPSGTRMHPKFWYDDGSVVFLVQSLQTVMFKVHKSLLARTGQRFAAIFERPPPGEGLGTEEDPMILSDVSADAFEALLSAIYISLPYPEFSTASLVHMLRTATLYGCPSIRAFAISTLSQPCHTLPPLDVLRLAKECDISEWVLPPLVEFSRVRLPLPVELGPELLSRVAQARDVLIARRIGLILDGDVDLHMEGHAVDDDSHAECGDIFRRELTRLHSLPAEEAPFPPEVLLRSLPTLRAELCDKCCQMGLADLELRVREWLDIDGDVTAVEGILLAK